MSNLPTHPGTDVPEPELPGQSDDDAVGRPLPDEPNEDTPTPDIPGAPGPDVVSPEPSKPL
ncbi:hypothetical protein [Aureimonas leprariae]|uniref:Uncharacterized protein n=1 Tax=Plantimonas leprariae TaxID=2615207 RepID=A0A7V7PT12_9HYPH|nr:hypothetical protein [Aureimonas leprariae]KAB0682804.1 hypothetical protein F6X38_01605 [Aureimonas leprariae]